MNSSSVDLESPKTVVNYEEAAVAEVVIGELEYRIDAGKEGTALCVSTRTPGAWDWSYVDEVRFDGTDVRSKRLERNVREGLTKALRAAIADSTDL
jgi:hypothetical protein